ncbi:hypothetical protein QJS10_CPB13g01084 [Acorus calamus]|uniref:Uncharacterized protein n=1 Tax=Acorus calamus TaxID=4465 RepID=A0AAV9DI25_ACOCL|nr:hypothetical protein QJS10_CPB13g01084 [Acorus calamus]
MHEVGVDVLNGGEAVHGDGPRALEKEVKEMEGVGFGGGHEERWVGGGGGGGTVVLGVHGGRGGGRRISVGEEEEPKR